MTYGVGSALPGDSGGTAPDSHRTSSPAAVWLPAVHHARGNRVNSPLTCEVGVPLTLRGAPFCGLRDHLPVVGCGYPQAKLWGSAVLPQLTLGGAPTRPWVSGRPSEKGRRLTKGREGRRGQLRWQGRQKPYRVGQFVIL